MIGEKLKALRIKKNMTQKQFGELFGLAESTIGMYERNEREPDFKTLLKIVDYFDISLDQLFGRSENTEILERLDKVDLELQLIKKIIAKRGN